MFFESIVRWSPPALFAACGIVIFFYGRRRIRDSTIAGPWCWALAVFAMATLGTAYMAFAQSKALPGEQLDFETLSFAMATFFF